MFQKLSYIALPYTSEDKSEVEYRVKRFCEIDSLLNIGGLLTVSPVLKHLLFSVNEKLPTDWNFWKSLSYRLLSSCDVLIVLKLKGWEKSTGVSAEIAFAKEKNIPIFYIESNEDIDFVIKEINK